jgi:hypothetical protein
MLQAELSTLFGGSHQKTTFPLTVQGKPGAYIRRCTYIVFLRCGAEFGGMTSERCGFRDR